MTSSEIITRIDEIVGLPDREEAYFQLASLFVQGPENMRKQIRNEWDFGVTWTYPNPRRLACSIRESHSCRERARAILIYNAINDLKQGDPRDELVSVAIVYHACLATNINPRELFEEVALISSPRIACFLKDFLRRDNDDKSLEAFMLVRKKNEDGEIEIFPSWMT